MAQFYQYYSSFMDYVIGMRHGRRSISNHTGQVLPANLTPVSYYDQLVPGLADHWLGSAKLDGPTAINVERLGKTWLSSNMEAQWYATGRPEYKVHPGMVEALAHTKLDVPVDAVKLPFPVFTVRFPKNHLREYRDAPFVRAIMVTTLNEEQLGEQRLKLVFSTNFTEDPRISDKLENHIITKVDLGVLGDSSDHTLQWYIDAMPKSNVSDGLYWPSREMTQEIVAIATAVAMIAIGADRNLVRPAARESTTDRLNRRRTEKRHGRGSAGTNYGFEVGADIRLPKVQRRYTKGNDEDSEERGRLAWGHIRSGHIRRQVCGPKNSLRKIIFVPPAVIRPDLPLKPKGTSHSIEPAQ